MSDAEIIEKFERENITLASLTKRSYAYFIDEVLVSLLFIFIYLDYLPDDASVEETILMINSMFLYVVLLKIAYQSIFVTLYGATLGKIFLKIKVVSVADLENPPFVYAFLRALVRVLSESLFYIGFIWAYFNSKKETWHDKIGKTLVVNAF
ncbi:MAG: RDD family protein [Sulfurospirillum sp.]|nr:RDD family protein [Sulfurospirillum sp.]